MKEKAIFKMCFVATLLLSSLFLLPQTSMQEVIAYSNNEDEAQPNLIITEVYPDTYTKNDLDEYIAIYNPLSIPINIEGWSITDNEGRIIFPAFIIRPKQTIYATRTASVFVEQMKEARSKELFPDFEYGSDSDPSVRQMQTERKAFRLRNKGDEIILQDKNEGEVDVVIYGDSDYEGKGWRGEPFGKQREGMVFKRKGNTDSDTADDWLLLCLGSSYFPSKEISFFGCVTAFASPDCSFYTLQREIENSSSSLYINLYQFENPYLMDLLLDAISRGVCVYLLLEANPVGGINDEELYIAGKIKEGGGKVRFSDAPFINHAKYAIVDNKTTVIESENWKNTGIPYDNSFGNRGWGIVIRNENLANYFNEVFFEDFQRGEDFFAEKKSIKDFIMSREISEGSYEPLFDPLTLNCNVTVMPVLAPDTVLSDETILGMVNSASKSIFVEQFSVQRIWDGENNPFIDALIEAARRGCEVKVLLDSKDYNLDTRNDNDEAVAYINEIAKVEELNLEAKLANLDGLVKVHNKGLIVDGEKTLISSLNWNANSIQNREAGVMVENAEIAFFYIDVFLHDWNMPAGKEGEKEPVTKIAYIVLTLLICFAISITIKWYKRI